MRFSEFSSGFTGASTRAPEWVSLWRNASLNGTAGAYGQSQRLGAARCFASTCPSAWRDRRTFVARLPSTNEALRNRTPAEGCRSLSESTPVDYDTARAWLAEDDVISLVPHNRVVTAIGAGLGTVLTQSDTTMTLEPGDEAFISLSFSVYAGRVEGGISPSATIGVVCSFR